MKSSTVLTVTTQMKASKQSFPLVLFVLSHFEKGKFGNFAQFRGCTETKSQSVPKNAENKWKFTLETVAPPFHQGR